MNNLPNKITVLRFLMIPAVITVFLVRFPYAYLVSACLFLLTAATDFLDGYLARKLNQITTVGKFLDPIADKVLVTAGLILVIEAQVLPVPFGSVACILILARDFAVGALRQVAASQNRVLAADKLGKFKTVLQDIAIPLLMVSVKENNEVYSDALYYVALTMFTLCLIMTLVSGAYYMIKNRAVFREDAPEKPEKED